MKNKVASAITRKPRKNPSEKPRPKKGTRPELMQAEVPKPDSKDKPFAPSKYLQSNAKGYLKYDLYHELVKEIRLNLIR